LSEAELAELVAFEFAALAFASPLLAFVSPALEFEFVLEFAGASLEVSGLLESTEILPVSAGIESSNAESIKVAAAAIVTFESTVVVPRGANAELEILLVKSAPASVLPGCSNTAATRARHERKNNPYKK